VCFFFGGGLARWVFPSFFLSSVFLFFFTFLGLSCAAASVHKDEIRGEQISKELSDRLISSAFGFPFLLSVIFFSISCGSARVCHSSTNQEMPSLSTPLTLHLSIPLPRPLPPPIAAAADTTTTTAAAAAAAAAAFPLFFYSSTHTT